ncbi:Peptidylprolyl isomerase [Heracleum sosnowskyi]|uniref:Peptidylprolyl isomerase n=1 Tax=Heracleum sosnowskyi TaxID=360622 RepID=A0AAD8NES2_9APIA|nr:Peptidylprolyl isomerase [Heracleum sosnowskyi]
MTAELESFLLINLRDIVEPEKKPKFSVGVTDTNLGSCISRATNIPCICDPIVRQLRGGVSLHFNALTQFPEPCNLDDAPSPGQRPKNVERGPLLRYKFNGCMVEDLEKGQTEKYAVALMNKVAIHYTVKRRRKDDKMFLDTTVGDPFKFRLAWNSRCESRRFLWCSF